MAVRVLAAAAAVTLAALSAPAAAVGSLMDIKIIDRVTGETLPTYWHDGRWWVPGKPGNRYAVSLVNRSGQRTLNVISVDGVNVISGETAAPNQTGYVLNPSQHAQITGWRKNLARVAAFEFTSLPDSYAARTGRPDHVGVIGIAVFREKVRYVPPPVPAPPVSRSHEEPRARADAQQESARDAAASPPRAAAPANESIAGAADREQRLGTGHGRSEYAPTQHVAFERASSTPDETIAIHYDSRDNLIALGVIREPRHHRHHRTPEPFPAASFVPDPPRRW